MSRRPPSIGRILTYLVLIIWTAVCIFPLYWVLLASLKSEDAVMSGPRYVPFMDFVPSLDAWRFILFDSHENLLWPLWNSLAVSVSATLLVILFSSLLLYALTRFHQNAKAASWLMSLMLSSRALPPVSMVIALYMAAKFAGLLDTRTALVITYTAINLPVATWLLRPCFGTRATEQEEAAMLEGMSHIGILKGVLLPMLLPSLAAVALIVFVLCWNEYFFAAYLTTNHASTLTPWMVGQLSLKEAQVGGGPEEWAHLSAAAVLMMAPLLVFSGMAMRLLSRSSAAG
jgi:multiple sugar transport system permease protein